MSTHYGAIAFTPAVRQCQAIHESGEFYGARADAASASPGVDRLTMRERSYLSTRDSMYVASVSETGWPYVQFRGGPPGFIRVLDEHTIGWADFRGNLQYISAGNLSADGRISIIVMDYAHRNRLKIFGHARIVVIGDDPELASRLADESYDAVVERAVIVDVDAFDWNCPQHITPRFTQAELEKAVTPLRNRIADLERQLASK
jgi:predicted pyridoxine 5'-phosphate oxidase superfamily flavin-nucleotide-binding protein